MEKTQGKKKRSKAQRKKKVHTAYLVRHALKGKGKHVSYGDEEPNRHDHPLTEAGEAQAKELAETLKDSGIERIFCSPFTRCAHTAFFVAEALGGVPINIESGLCEWTPGVTPQTVSAENLHESFPLVDVSYESLVEVDSAETLQDVHARCRRFVEAAEEKGYLEGNTLFVAHAASTIALCRAFLDDTEVSFYPAMASITKLQRTTIEPKRRKTRKKKKKPEKEETEEKEEKEEGENEKQKKKKRKKRKEKDGDEEERDEKEGNVSDKNGWEAVTLGSCEHLSKGAQYGWKFKIFQKELNSLGAMLNEYKHSL